MLRSWSTVRLRSPEPSEVRGFFCMNPTSPLRAKYQGGFFTRSIGSADVCSKPFIPAFASGFGGNSGERNKNQKHFFHTRMKCPRRIGYARRFLLAFLFASISRLMASRFVVFLECDRLFLPIPVLRFAMGSSIHYLVNLCMWAAYTDRTPGLPRQ